MKIYFEYYVEVNGKRLKSNETQYLTIFSWKTPIVLSSGELIRFSKEDAFKKAKELNGIVVEQPIDPEGWHLFFPKFITP